MKSSKTSSIFFKGLLFTMPILLTFAILTWAVTGAESVLSQPLKALIPYDLHFPGMGILVAIGLIYLIGLAIHGKILRFLFAWMQSAMDTLPVVSVIYQNIKEMFDFVSGAKDDELERVVLVEMNGDMRLIGFVTKQETDILGKGNEPLHAVYLPMSYQMGGYLVYLPDSRLQTLDITKQEAMQRILTANISSAKSTKMEASA